MNWKREYRKSPRLLVILPLLLFAWSGWSQTEEHWTSGQIFEAKTGMAVPGVHVVNTRSEQGTVSDALGRFTLKTRAGDTLVFSHLSYAYLMLEVTDSLPTVGLRIALKEQNYLLDEVGIFAYELTTNDPRDMEIGEPLVPREEDIDLPEHAPATLMNPVDLLYEMFGKTPRQLRELRRLMQEDAWKRKLAGRNGDILRELTGMSREEVATFAFYCRYSPNTIRHATDYQLLTSLLDCYEEYQKEREVEQILEEWD